MHLSPERKSQDGYKVSLKFVVYSELNWSKLLWCTCEDFFKCGTSNTFLLWSVRSLNLNLLYAGWNVHTSYCWMRILLFYEPQTFAYINHHTVYCKTAHPIYVSSLVRSVVNHANLNSLHPSSICRQQRQRRVSGRCAGDAYSRVAYDATFRVR